MSINTSGEDDSMREVMVLRPFRGEEHCEERVILMNGVINEMFRMTLPSARVGREETGLLLGLVGEITDLQGIRRRVRIAVTAVDCDSISTSASAWIPPETMVLVDEAAKRASLNIVGGFHSHPWHGGHEFLSGTDLETLGAYAALDHGWLCVVLDPIRRNFTVFRWR